MVNGRDVISGDDTPHIIMLRLIKAELNYLKNSILAIIYLINKQVLKPD